MPNVEPIRCVPRAELLLNLSIELPFTEALALWMETVGAEAERLDGRNADRICMLGDQLVDAFASDAINGLKSAQTRRSLIAQLRAERLTVIQIGRLTGIPAMTLLRTINPRAHIGYLDCEADLAENGWAGRNVPMLAEQYGVANATVRAMAEVLGLGEASVRRGRAYERTTASDAEMVLTLRDLGHSVKSICEQTGMNYRKVYRLLAAR